MLRLIPGTVFRMFGAHYSKIILQYPVALSLLVYSACSASREQWFVFRSCLKMPSRTIYRIPPFIRKVSILRFLFFREYFCPASKRFVRSSNDLLSLPSGCPVFSGNYSGVSFASPRTVFSGTILPRTIFFSIVVVVPVYLACVLYPASKITIIIINKCPYSLGIVSKFCTGSAQYSSQFRCCEFVPYVTSVTVSNYDTFRHTVNKTNWILPSIWSPFYYCGPKSVTYLPILQLSSFTSARRILARMFRELMNL